MTDNLTSIADKITKMIAKAESSTHAEEADAFMSKVHKMMEDYGLSLLDLGRLNSDDPVSVDREAYTILKSGNSWAREVLCALSEYYGCEHCYFVGHKEVRFCLAGRKSAQVTFKLMAGFILRQVRKMANDAAKRGLFESPSKGRTSIGNALALRVSRLAYEMRAKDSASASSVNALVPVDMNKAALKEAYENIRIVKARDVKMDLMGHLLASEVSLNLQTGSSDQHLKIEHEEQQP